jgi:hypothetical protein
MTTPPQRTDSGAPHIQPGEIGALSSCAGRGCFYRWT